MNASQFKLTKFPHTLDARTVCIFLPLGRGIVNCLDESKRLNDTRWTFSITFSPLEFNMTLSVCLCVCVFNKKKIEGNM